MDQTGQHSNSAVHSLHTSAEAERKLWLDYLAKLNDRELQKARASGATTWVVLAVLATILYRFFRQLPELLRANVSWASVGTLVALEINFITYFGIFVVLLIQYCKGPEERRIFTDLKGRAYRVAAVTIYIASVALVVLQVVLLQISVLPRFVLWVLRFLTAWWAINLALALRDGIRRLRQKVTIPKSTANITMKYPGILAAVIAPVFLFAGTGLSVYVRKLIFLSPSDGILVFDAGTQIVAATFLMLFIFYRALESQSRHSYLKLERDIVLENLAPGEIKRQFSLQILGARISDWLSSITERVEEDQRQFESLLKAGEAECAEIENIPPQYALEREGRGKQLSMKLNKGLKEYAEEVIKVIAEQREAVKDFGVETHEMQIIKEQLDRLSRGDELYQRFGTLMDRISRLREGDARERAST